MKKTTILVALAAACLLSSCEKPASKPDTISGINPESATVFTDETLPELVAMVEPEGAALTWSSSDPDIISVEDGVLKFEVRDIPEASKDIVITATTKDGESASATITVKGQIARYEPLDMKAEFGLILLDRNLGASAPGEVGYYYQLGKNTPVAKNDDAAVNENYSADWSAESLGYVDWKVAENTPCPIGWRLPTADEVKKIADSMEAIVYYEMDFATEEEFNAACDIEDKLNAAYSGRFALKDGAVVKQIPDARYFWADGFNDTGKKSGYVAYEDNNFPNCSYNATLDWAIPVRCVKAE